MDEMTLLESQKKEEKKNETSRPRLTRTWLATRKRGVDTLSLSCIPTKGLKGGVVAVKCSSTSTTGTNFADPRIL